MTETKAKKELDEHDLKSQINSLLRKIEQLETSITDERALRKVCIQEKTEILLDFPELFSYKLKSIIIILVLFKDNYNIFESIYLDSKRGKRR